MSPTRSATPTVPRWRTALWLTIAALLALPALAMQATTQLNWGAEDFAAAALLLVGGGLLFGLVIRATTRPASRTAIGTAILLAIALLWTDLAVGIF